MTPSLARPDTAFKTPFTQKDYDRLLDEQEGACAICRHAQKSAVLDANSRRLAVDHDHNCCPSGHLCAGCVRGLLCARCNLGLGNFEDDPSLLQAAAQYLYQRSPSMWTQEEAS